MVRIPFPDCVQNVQLKSSQGRVVFDERTKVSRVPWLALAPAPMSRAPVMAMLTVSAPIAPAAGVCVVGGEAGQGKVARAERHCRPQPRRPPARGGLDHRRVQL